MKRSLFFLFLSVSLQLSAQIKRPVKQPRKIGSIGNIDTLGTHGEVTVKYDKKTKYTDFKIIDFYKDTTVVDTTLTLSKNYRFNFLRKDDFETISFHNLGQTQTKLGTHFTKNSFLPTIGAQSKHYNYLETKDVVYYNVPTPTSELMYRSGLEQGQVLHSFLTMNLSPQLNVSIAYNGLRSLGKYRNTLSSHGNFRTTASYHTKNNRYYLRAHYAAQDLTNSENGGLTPEAIVQFETNNERYLDRVRLETLYIDAQNSLIGKRYYINQDYTVYGASKDSVSTKYSSLKLGHSFTYETKHYRFNQDAPHTFFGNAYRSRINDHVVHKSSLNQVYASLNTPYVLGKLTANIGYLDYTYGYNDVVFLNSQTIQARINGNALIAGADWNGAIKNFHINATASTIVSGNITGSEFKGVAFIKKDSIFTAKASVAIQSKTPNFNFLLFQSDYINYNWQNDFKNEQKRTLGFAVDTQKFGKASLDLSQVDHYSYFDNANKPQQATSTVSYIKLRVHKDFHYKKFTLENTLQYQEVASGETVFRVPKIITRNTLYFSDHVFKGKPMYLQTGITFKYFTKYYANNYNPLLSEFTIQNNTEIGNFPIVDFFINAQIRRTRLYLKAENFTSGFTGRNYYSAPNYPYRDFIVRFGLVWNFFI